MMKTPLTHFTATLSLRQMAAISIAGGLLSVSGFLVLIPYPHHTRYFWPAAAASLLLVVIGYLIAFSAQSEIESGIANHRWADEDVLGLRAVTGSPYIRLIIWAFLGGLIVAVALNYHSIVWPIFILIQNLTRLAMVTKEPRTEPSRPVTPSTFASLQSDHWGRPRP